jgi:hypothetical protein
MSIQTDILKDIGAIPPNRYPPVSGQQFDQEKAQMRDQIAMLEAEIDRQSTIIDALIKAIKVIERG